MPKRRMPWTPERRPDQHPGPGPLIRWLPGAIAVVVLVLAVVWVLFVPVADWLARHDVGSAGGALHETAVDNARGRLLTLGAGLFAAGALAFTARNFTLSRRTLELTEQGQVADRYTRAIEQLGSDKFDVRIGGIYALERIAWDSVRDYRTVIEVLTAFIREHSREQWPLPEQQTDPAPPRTTRSDVQAALTVVGRRNARLDSRERPVDLSGANLTRANLDGANLTGAVLTGAVLGSAVSTDHSVRLTGAVLSGARLGGADLTDTDLTDTDLTDTNLRYARLGGARWPAHTPVLEGWRLNPGSGRLESTATGFWADIA